MYGTDDKFLFEDDVLKPSPACWAPLCVTKCVVPLNG